MITDDYKTIKKKFKVNKKVVEFY